MSPYLKIISSVRMLALLAFSVLYFHSNGQEYEIEPATFNSSEADFSCVFNGKDVIFCSTRAKDNLSFDEDTLTMYYTDLYISRLKKDGTFSNAEPIKGNVNTDFNEGHATFNHNGTIMYYTANLKNYLANKFEKTNEYKLGIFIAEKINGQWVAKGEFPFNSTNGKYSLAHPSLSLNDSILYFCSNMLGGSGNSDIYRCRWENEKWSTPENLGSKINSRGNEFFPFINEFGVLYFSTDARNDSEGMDIYYSIPEENEFQKPVRLSNSINSESDEFAYQERLGVNQGCFSSNRNNGQDDIFFFKKYNNTFIDCHENYSADFCYHFFDDKLSKIDSLPIAYEWSMGDGTILTGDSIDYCYKNFGKYHVTLNVIDTTTQVVFKKISETDLEISKQDKPFILCHDTTYEAIPFECMVEFIGFDDFDIDEVQWQFDDGSKYTGRIFQHTFSTAGHHQVKCAITGKRRPNGVLPMVCVYKDIVCVVPQDNQKTIQVLACCDKREYEKIAMRAPAVQKSIASSQLKSIFKLVIAESKEQLALTHEIFSIDSEIIVIKTDSSFQYTIAHASQWQELLPVFKELKESGFTKMYTTEYTASQLKSATDHIVPRNPQNAIKLHSINDYDSKLTLSKNKSDKSDQPFEINEEDNAESPYSSGEDSTSTLSHNENHGFAIDADTINSERPNKPISEIQYRIVLFSSSKVIPFNDPKFSTIDGEISEYKRDDHYEYTIMSSNEESELIETTTRLKNEGLLNVHIEKYNAHEADNSFLRVGKYITTPNDKISPENNSLEDITNSKIWYRVVVLNSDERVPFNNPKFSAIKSEISELKKEDHYEYTVMAVPKASDLSNLLIELKNKGYESAHIESFHLQTLNAEFIRNGKYFQPKDSKRLNVEFSKLSDIKFEYNSAEIKQESYKNLNYIAAMLMLENDFTLKIAAHTCSIGGSGFNKNLSEQRAQSVVDYFIKKGISKERLLSHGYGPSQPIQSNETEMGRIANRRVEFVIVFEMNKNQR